MRHKSFKANLCPVARSLDTIGEWWSLLIVRDALSGIRRFSDFHKSLGLAKNILSARLKKLVACGIMEHVPASDGSAYQEYALVFCIVNVFTDSGNSAYWQYASSRAQTVPHGFGSQAVTGDQSSSQHAPRDCSPPRHCPWGGRGNCQSRSGAQPIYVSAHRIAVAEAI